MESCGRDSKLSFACGFLNPLSLTGLAADPTPNPKPYVA